MAPGTEVHKKQSTNEQVFAFCFVLAKIEDKINSSTICSVTSAQILISS